MRSLNALFGKSPFGPIQKHMAQAVACAEGVPALFEALIAGDLDALKAQQQNVAALESEADLIKNELRSHLPRKLFMPVDRRDLLEILDLQDTIADVAEDIGDLLVARKWEVPEEMREPLMTFVHTAVAASTAAGVVLDRLDSRGRKPMRFLPSSTRCLSSKTRPMCWSFASPRWCSGSRTRCRRSR